MAKSQYDRENLALRHLWKRGEQGLFPHLVAMKEAKHLSSEDMGAIIGRSRQTFEYKLQCGNFTPFECKAFCKQFGKSFDYLFATMEEIDQIDAMITAHQEAG